ncbi:MAG: DeoR family transcriptional regulator [bacterium]|nr:DeoR family transcriptional regulator [bacterium]
MNKIDIIELTDKLYKLTLLFPKKEPLRYKMREVGDRILENVISLEVSQSSAKRSDFLVFEIEKDLEIIISYFEIIKWQNWVSYFDVLEIKEKYDKIKIDLLNHVENLEPEQNKPLEIARPKAKNLDSRKEKILTVLKEKEKIQVWELSKILPQVSKRTLRRDFDFLLKKGLIKRIGQGNNTFYSLIK